MNALAAIQTGNARLPQAYEAAKQALATCESLDECKDWSDKAAALASYAKQAGDDELMKQAVRIRDRAIRRCGELLKQFDGRGEHWETKREGDRPSTSQTEAAQQAGLTPYQAKTAVRVANIPTTMFERMVESEAPPTITALAKTGTQSRPAIDHGDRDPRDFNKAMHFKGMLQDYSRELSAWSLPDLLPRLIETERAAVRKLIGEIDAVHDTIMTRI